MRLGKAAKLTLLVEPDALLRRSIAEMLDPFTEVVARQSFVAARSRLLTMEYDWLVTNIRLEQYNGVHLVYLARGTKTRCVTYAHPPDAWLARAAQSAGAFHEPRERLPFAFANYVRCRLPAVDHRDPEGCERREVFRGGRRCTDRIAAHAASAHR